MLESLSAENDSQERVIKHLMHDIQLLQRHVHTNMCTRMEMNTFKKAVKKRVREFEI